MKSLAVSDKYGWARYTAHQAYYSLVGREYEWELMPLALDQKVSTIVWGPLSQGRLSGKFRRNQPIPPGSRVAQGAGEGPAISEEWFYSVVDVLDAVSEETGKTVAQLKVWKGKADQVQLGVARPLLVSVPRGRYPELKPAMEVPRSLVAPITAGQEIGTVKVSLDGEVIAQAPLVAIGAVEEAGFFKRLWDAFWMWWESE